MANNRFRMVALVLPVLAACGGGGGDGAVSTEKASVMALQAPAGSATPENGGVMMSGGSAVADATVNADTGEARAGGSAKAGIESLIGGLLGGLAPANGNFGQILDPSAASNPAVPNQSRVPKAITLKRASKAKPRWPSVSTGPTKRPATAT